jgi:hypothetical protein
LNPLDSQSHVFVLKVWLEEPATASQPALWRGQITHAITGDRCYFQSLQPMLDFLLRYLNQWESDRSRQSHE